MSESAVNTLLMALGMMTLVIGILTIMVLGLRQRVNDLERALLTALADGYEREREGGG